MSGNPYYASIEALPETLPIFPLPGVLLLPGGQLPLNIFEPRYLAMTQDALGSDRLIGMVQPEDPEDQGPKPDVYKTGCAGRMTAFSETSDGRYLITLTGLCRFGITRELPITPTGYRRVAASYGRYRLDLEDASGKAVDRDRLTAAVRSYLARYDIAADWEAIESAADETLVTSLAMICPFRPNEKQALLESPDLAGRAELLTSLLEMAVHHRQGGGAPGVQ